MKKTEKIELRVDHAEKDRLSTIAERRGLTVSDIVREALSVELGASQTAYPRWLGLTALASFVIGLSALCLSLGFGLKGPVGNAATVIYPDTMDVSAGMITTMGRSTQGQDIRFSVPLHHADSRTFDLKNLNGETVRVALKSQPGENGILMHVTATSCILRDARCDMEPMPSVSIQMRPTHGARASTTAFWGETLYIEIEFSTSTTRINPPQPAES